MKKVFMFFMIISLIFISTICVNAGNRNVYPIEEPDIIGQKGDINYEVYYQYMYPTDSTTYIFVTHENWSDLYLVTQIVVVYTDADYDINFRYGYPVPGETFAIVNAGVTHNPTKTVDYVDYECHVYLNNVYLDTLLFAYHY